MELVNYEAWEWHKHLSNFGLSFIADINLNYVVD